MWEELEENNNCPSLEVAGDMGPLLMKSVSFFSVSWGNFQNSFTQSLTMYSDILFPPVSGA